MLMTVETNEMLYPMFAMFLWTFVVMLRNVQVRVGSVLKGELTNEYFELFRGGKPSDVVIKTGNHFRNLMELPPLFYVVCLAIMLIHRQDGVFLMLAWSYAALRVVHSPVHLTFNKVPPRFLFFALSNMVLLTMWIRLSLSL
jgi:hypothetical protein